MDEKTRAEWNGAVDWAREHPSDSAWDVGSDTVLAVDAELTRLVRERDSARLGEMTAKHEREMAVEKAAIQESLLRERTEEIERLRAEVLKLEAVMSADDEERTAFLRQRLNYLGAQIDRLRIENGRLRQAAEAHLSRSHEVRGGHDNTE